MESGNVEFRRLHGTSNGFFRLPGLDGKSELAVKHPGGRMRVCVRIDAGGDAERYLLRLSQTLKYGIKQRKLMEVVDNDGSDARLDGSFKLLLTLIVTVEVNVGGIDTCCLCCGQLTTAHDIKPDALLRKQAEKRHIRKGLGGVDDGAFAGVVGIKRRAEAPGRITQLSFIEHVQRCALLASEFNGIEAADFKMAVVARLRRRREN